MTDVFDLMEQDQHQHSEKQKMVQALEQSKRHGLPVIKSERDQWVLHQHWVENKPLREIADELGLTVARVTDLLHRGKTSLRHYLYREAKKNKAPEMPENEPVTTKALGYNIYEIMLWPDENRVAETTQILLMPLVHLELPARIYNTLSYGEIHTLNHLLKKYNSSDDLLKFRYFGRKSAIELEEWLQNHGLKFRNQTALTPPQKR